MAKATILEGVTNARTVVYTHSAAVEAYDIIEVGDFVLIALNDALANVANVYLLGYAKVIMPKAAGGGTAIANLSKVYWDNSAAVVTNTATANPLAGICIEAAADADTTVTIFLCPMIIGATGASIQNEIADPGDGEAIPVTASGVVPITTGADGETNTLAIPSTAGQILVLCMDVDGGGDRVITVAAAINSTGNNTITLGDAGDVITLIGVQVAGALVWRVLVNDGAGLTTVE